MRSNYFLHNLLHHAHSRQELTLLYISYSIRTAIFSYLAIFLPIYYFKSFIEVGLGQQQAWAFTIIIFILIYFLQILSSYFAAKICSKYSLRTSLLLSVFFLLLFSITLSFGKSLLLNIASCIFIGIHLGLWWETYHIDFSLVGNKEEFGKEIGVRQSLGVLTAVVAPLWAAYLIQKFGYLSLFAYTSFLIFLLGLTLFLLKEKRSAPPISLKNLLEEIRRYKKDLLAYIGVGGESVVAEMLWPLFLYVLLQKPLLVGSVTAGVSLIAFLTKLAAGAISDQTKKEKVELFGAFTVGMTWFGKFITQSVVGIIFFDIAHKIFSSFFYLPIIALSYLRALTSSPSTYITVREIGYQTGKIVVLAISLLIILSGASYWWLIALGAITPTTILILRKN